MPTKTDCEDTPSVLSCLRALHPDRRLTLGEAMRIAELQAQRLLSLAGVADVPISTEVISALPRIHVEYDLGMPGVASGASDWDSVRRRWVIALNPTEPDTRTRLTTGHEFKHILDHGKPTLYGVQRSAAGRPAAEFIADYFAGCLLMPRQLLTRAWYQGIQKVADLASMFDVSAAAMSVRLRQLGLLENTPRCATPADRSTSRPPQARRHRYLRSASPHPLVMEASA